jgi:hypothetical protein
MLEQEREENQQEQQTEISDIYIDLDKELKMVSSLICLEGYDDSWNYLLSHLLLFKGRKLPLFQIFVSS